MGWTFLATFSLCGVVLLLELECRDPALVRRRTKAGPSAEREPSQMRIQAANAIFGLGFLVVAGLDHRFHWSNVTLSVIVAVHILIVLSFIGIQAVLLANTWAASVVEVSQGQHVIDAGPYAIVRHPMYSCCLMLFLACALALGSYWACLVMVPVSAGIIARLSDEERFLKANLSGYVEYTERLRWRLVPCVW